MRWRWALVAMAVFGVLLEVADARVGGGQGFSTGGGGGGYSGGGGGGGDGLGVVIYIIIRLCLEHPAIGIPLLILVIAAFGVRAWMMNRDEARQVHRMRQTRQSVRRAAVASTDAVIAPLVARDPGFSEAVFQPFAQLVHRRALPAAVTGDFSALTPFVAPSAQDQLTNAMTGITDVRDVVHAGVRIARLDQQNGRDILTVELKGSRVQTRNGSETPVYVEETWRFERDTQARSLPPEDTLRLGCPSCGSAVKTDTQGRCEYCGTPVTAGQLQWQATGLRVDLTRPIQPPSVSRFSGGDEPGANVPSVVAPDLGAAFRRFQGSHPDFDQAAFHNRVTGVFTELQAAWSQMDWDRARPYTTDTLYETLRFQIEQYRRAGLTNRVEDLQVERVDMVRVRQDAWYDVITVRIWASNRDWVEDSEGRVVGGNKSVRRRFSEYWTFLRSTGSGASAHGVGSCPSCGAALDRVNAAGVCEYCDSRIVSGEFDWVLSRIEQPEVYGG